MKKERINKRKIQNTIIRRPNLLPILDDDDEGDIVEEFHRSLERTIRGLPRKDCWSNVASCPVTGITLMRSGLHKRLNLFRSDSWLSSPGNSLEKLLFNRSSPWRHVIRPISDGIWQKNALFDELRTTSETVEQEIKRLKSDDLPEFGGGLGSQRNKEKENYKGHYLLRDAYDDMVLDGVQPTRDTFHSLIVGAMKGSRIQDAFFFRDEMKTMGLVPDVSLYNFLISACGKCKNSDSAILIGEAGVATTLIERRAKRKTSATSVGEAVVGAEEGGFGIRRSSRGYTIVRDMTAAGLGLNKFCYAGLIAAQKNKKPATEDIATKIIELVKQSKGWSSVEASKDAAENTLETLLEMLKQDGKSIDAFIVMQMMRCYFRAGDFDRGHTTFTDYFSSGRPPITELYVTLVEGAMIGYTPRGMEIAENTLNQMVSMKIFPNVNAGSELLIAASGEAEGSYTCANFIWDMLRNRGVTPSFPAVDAYLKGLKATPSIF
ncbi:Pentatricopeptide repeat-containing protein [Acorus gramineus]|uniref:Pentatricopeptide repeat-containing protein n=1 Tax=Acorus gramineus TaxID=55184 RepID=A0AAV9B601_ACOGR|nr:Pentatricopeptide repeat-containing protein [Acorus gramineus]